MIEEGASPHQFGDTFTTEGNQSSDTENILLPSLLPEMLSVDFKMQLLRNFSKLIVPTFSPP